MMFPIQEGVVQELIEPQLESPHEMTWIVRLGQQTKACKSNGDAGAFVLVFNADQEALQRDFLICKQHTAIVY